MLYAAISVHWGLGGTWLLDTVGGSLEEQGRARATGVIAAVWAAAVLKALAAALPVIAVRQANRPDRSRAVLVLAWAAAGILCAYGFVLSAAGILVQTGVIHAAASADHRALAWHAYLWDPWFLIWGLLAGNALRQARSPRTAAF